MSDFPFGYEQIHPTTWFYLSSLLTIGLYFKFNRAWSVRNLDLVLLILLGPGLLLQVHGHQLQQSAQRLAAAASVIQEDPHTGLPGEGITTPGDNGQPNPANAAVVPSGASANAGPVSSSHAAQIQRGRFFEILGFVWLFGIGGLLMLRMLLDPMMTRRPLLEPNLLPGGLIFIACSLFIFMMANVITGTPTEDDLTGPQGAEKILALEAPSENENAIARHGPGYPWLHVIPNLAIRATVSRNQQLPEQSRAHVTQVLTAKTMAVLAQLAIVAGVVLIAYRHFDNVKMGIGAAALYLILPYTAEMTGRVLHLLPGALLVWAVLWYRRPLTAGLLLGLAMGVFYYPLFLLPLWLSFYWQRGLMRFVTGVLLMLGLSVLSLVFTSNDVAGFWQQVQQQFGLWFARFEGLEGVWGLGWDPIYRLPVMATFMVLSVALALWPSQKNLGTLMSCSAALMLGTQFWHGFGDGGGLYLGWYLPLVLLTVFRPNLEDRVALSVLGEGWFPRRRRTDARLLDEKKKDKAA
jgi:hypothetical protein